jgi:hypothetical protein
MHGTSASFIMNIAGGTWLFPSDYLGRGPPQAEACQGPNRKMDPTGVNPMVAELRMKKQERRRIDEE